jgi:small GTP-binding protein
MQTRDIVQGMNVDLNDTSRELLLRERAALTDLHVLLNQLDAGKEDLANLKIALTDLEGMFLLVVCGEYNAGKSSLINALLGEKVMLEGVTPTTDRVTVLTYGETLKDTEESVALLRREFPARILRDLAFVDTPGTNAVIKEHQALTERFIPRADLILFVTSADRPFTESERAFLEMITSWGKKIVIVINKMDIIDSNDERKKIITFVREHARTTLGVTPQVFILQSKLAFKARQDGDTQVLSLTGLPELEAYIEKTLAIGERVKLKLSNPLGVGLHLVHKYQNVISERILLLESDRKNLEHIDRQLSQYDKDMSREFENYMARVKTVLLEVERRGDIFFDDTVRLRNVIGLMNNDRIRTEFETRVIRNADMEIDLAVSEMVDWFIQKNLNLWEDVMRFVNDRREAGAERIIGEVGGRFQYDRSALIRNLRQSAEEVMATYDEQSEARRLADRLQNSVFQSGIGLVGGLGLGAAVLAIVSSAAVDITGVTLGVALAGVGLFVIPRRRQQAKNELHKKMQELRDGLDTSIKRQFATEMRKASEKLHQAIEPYTRFVRSEIERLEEMGEALETSSKQLSALKREADALVLNG